MGQVKFVNGITINYDNDMSAKDLKKMVGPIKKGLIQELKDDSRAYHERYVNEIRFNKRGLRYDKKDS